MNNQQKHSEEKNFSQTKCVGAVGQKTFSLLLMLLISLVGTFSAMGEETLPPKTSVKKLPVKKSPAKKTATSKKTSPKQPEVGANYDKVAYDIYVRVGLIAYLKQDYAEAAKQFKAAKPYQPPRNFTVAHGTILTGIERLIRAAKKGKSLTPQNVLEGDKKARLILMLADVYHTGGQYERSLELCNRLLKGAARKATKTQRSYAYFRRARNYYSLDSRGDERKRNSDLALRDYLASQKTDPKTEWADNCLFKAANVYWNHSGNARKAIYLYRRLLKLYPDSDEAERSAYFIGVCYEWSGNYRDAKTAYLYSQKHFPASRYGRLVEMHLKETSAKLKSQKTTPRRKITPRRKTKKK